MQRSLLAEIIPCNNFLDTLSGWPVSKVMAAAWGHNRHHLWSSRERAARTAPLHSSNRAIHLFNNVYGIRSLATHYSAASHSLCIMILLTFYSKSGVVNPNSYGSQSDNINNQSRLLTTRQTLLGQRGEYSEDAFSARLKRAHSLCTRGTRRGRDCVSSGQSVSSTGPDV